MSTIWYSCWQKFCLWYLRNKYFN